MESGAATWIAPEGEEERNNQLGAAHLVAEREGTELTAVIEGIARFEAAIDAAREAGLLILPDSNRIFPGIAEELAILRWARSEDWRLLLLSLGADSSAESGELTEEFLARLAALPAPDTTSPMPPAEMRRKVSVGGEDMFRRSGLLHVEAVERCLAEAGVALAETRDLLEWGCGVGRMTVHLMDRAPSASITAADTDAEAVAWVRGHLEVAAAEVLPLSPPSGLADDAFDLIVGHSVFSHLDVELQDQWLAELARVLQSGGHAAVSFNGPIGLRWHFGHPLIEVPAAIEDEVGEKGVAVWREDGWDDEFYDGYHTTFHSHEYVREHWSRWFDVVAVEEAAALPIQDVAILRAR